jgi:anti-sigma regulatory factor (Ser/Thr protein kinase)
LLLARLGNTTEVQFAQDLSLSERAPQAARDALARLSAMIPADRLADIKLVVSELVTNAVQHSGQAEGTLIHLSVNQSPDRVRIEVNEPGFVAFPRPAPTDAVSGRGLYIVTQASDRWGQIPDDGVWAEFDLP